MGSYGPFRCNGHRPFTSGMSSTEYHGPSTGGAGYSLGIDNPTPTGAGHAPDSPYPAMPGSDTYDPIWAEYEDGLPDYEQPEPGHGFVSRSAAPQCPPPPAHFEPPQPSEYGSPADQLLTAWSINRAWEELPDSGEIGPDPPNIGTVAQPAHAGGNPYGFGSAEPLQPGGGASGRLEDAHDPIMEELLSLGIPRPGESFEATGPYADDPRFGVPLEETVEQEVQQSWDPYRLTEPQATLETIVSGFGFDEPDMGPLW